MLPILPAAAMTPIVVEQSITPQSSVPDITAEETAVLTELLRQYGYGGDSVFVQPLFDADNAESYLLVVSENGHLIVERQGYRFCQCGEGNPYAGYEDSLCYYGGPLCYYTSRPSTRGDTTTYYDLLQNTYTEEITSLERNSESDIPNATRGNDANNLSEVRLPNDMDNIRRIAFGYNDDNTCSAVATGIALSYIARQENMKVVANYHVAETIINPYYYAGDAEKYGSYKGKIIKLHPNAYALHRYITDYANMGPANFGYEVWDAIDDYCEARNELYPLGECYQLNSNWTMLPRANTIRSNIEAGRPVLITTIAAGDYSTHTMCVYGHERINGDDMLLVHFGWWNKSDIGLNCLHNVNINGSTVSALSELWIDETWAKFGHYFSYQNPLKAYKDADMPSFTEYSYDGILYCVKNGIMSGRQSNRFDPNGELNRGEIATILYRAAGSPSTSGTEPFTDVKPSDYFYNAVRWAYNAGLVDGTKPTLYSPTVKLTREQLALILYRFAQHQNKNTSISANIKAKIADYSKISSWARTGVKWAASHQVLVSDNGLLPVNISGKYRPKANATRAEAAYAIYAVLEKCG